MVSRRVLWVCCICILSACSATGGATRADFSSASDNFGKAIDSANDYVQKHLSSYRRDKRLASILTRQNQLRYVLISGKVPETDSWKSPVDGQTLLCEWQLNYFNASAAWSQVQALRQPLSTLSQPSKAQGFSLFFESITNNYQVKTPGANGQPSVAAQKLLDQCQTDFVGANKALGLPPSGVKEATGIPQLDAAVAAYQALNTFFGALGSLIDDQRRADALRQFINSPATQLTFNSGIDNLGLLLGGTADNNRGFIAQTYALGYVQYQVAYATVRDQKGLPTDIGQRAVKVAESFNSLASTQNALLNASDAYDAVIDVHVTDQFKALKQSFADLVKLSNDKTISAATLIAQAQRLQQVFQNGKDAYTKLQASLDAVAKTSNTGK